MITIDESDIAYESYKNHYQEIYDMIFEDMVDDNFETIVQHIPISVMMDEIEKRGFVIDFKHMDD